MTEATQRAYLEETGTLHLLNYCVSIRRNFQPRNPHKLLLGLLKRDRGIVLSKTELSDFVSRSSKVHPVFLFRTLMLSIPQDADCSDKAWDIIAQLAALLFCRICSISTLHSFVDEQKAATTPPPPLSSLILQIAISRLHATGIAMPCKVQVVFPLTDSSNCYKSLTKEGMLTEHVRQLQWLFVDTNVEWSLVYSDANPSGYLAGAAERVINDAMEAGEVDLPSKVSVVQVHTTEKPAHPTCSRIRGFKGCIERCKKQQGEPCAHVILIGSDSEAVHLGLVGTLVAELNAGREVVLADPCHHQSSPPRVASRDDLLFQFAWKSMLLPELLTVTIPREPPLCGISGRILPNLHIRSAEPCTFFTELVVRGAEATNKKPGKMFSTLPVILSPVAPGDVEPKQSYCSYVQAVCDLAEVLFEDQSVDTDVTGWYDFLRSITTKEKWDKLVASPMTALALDSQHLNTPLTFEDFKGDSNPWVEAKESAASETATVVTRPQSPP